MTKTNVDILENKDFPPFHLLIPAAGSSTRLGAELPKPYVKINGKAIIRHTIEKFLQFKTLKSVSIVINEAHLVLYHDAVKGLENINFIVGSNSRKLSVYNGLNSLPNLQNEDIILIHDAARPMVQRADIAALLDTMKNSAAATLVCPVMDSLVQNNNDISREDMWAIQTPQAFHYGLIKQAHEKFLQDDNFTDDASLIRSIGKEVILVPSSKMNFKITTLDDLNMAKQLMAQDYETRTAMGYDVHAFEKEPSARQLMLGGIVVPHEFALMGHSDADVVLHAITDAVLGCINEGDIGTHFPPSDEKWKNADSAIFLKEAMRLLEKRRGTLKFIDVTVMAEEPKIGPHSAAMQTRIAEIMNIAPERVSIKATTTEKLGFTGRKEGMAAQALATINLPVTQ